MDIVTNSAIISKVFLLVSFVIFIPVSAACYYYSRHSQRHSEIKRYIKILEIKKTVLFEHQHPLVSLSVAVFFVTFLIACFWLLILFGFELKITCSPNYLLGGISVVGITSAECDAGFESYQSGALLTLNMAFMGAYLWGIQNIVQRYSMNDLIPAAYYNLGVRIIFSTLLALVFYHMSMMTPELLGFVHTSDGPPEREVKNMTDRAYQLMPIVAFLIGMFPQRGLKWLTEKFSMFTQLKDPSVRDLPLEMIEGITMYDRVRLHELGIDSCYDMANVDYIPYLFKVPYSPRVLIDWILQAKLCVYFGEHVKALRENGIHTVWQFKSFDEEALQELVRKTPLTEDVLMMVKKQISNDDEIKRLVDAQLALSQYWGKSQDNE